MPCHGIYMTYDMHGTAWHGITDCRENTTAQAKGRQRSACICAPPPSLIIICAAAPAWATIHHPWRGVCASTTTTAIHQPPTTAHT